MRGTPEDARNYDLIQKMNKLEKGKRGFTIDREAFRETLTDYAINQRVLFTPNNPHYKYVWNMKQVIDGWTRLERINILTPSPYKSSNIELKKIGSVSADKRHRKRTSRAQSRTSQPLIYMKLYETWQEKSCFRQRTSPGTN